MLRRGIAAAAAAVAVAAVQRDARVLQLVPPSPDVLVAVLLQRTPELAAEGVVDEEVARGVQHYLKPFKRAG